MHLLYEMNGNFESVSAAHGLAFLSLQERGGSALEVILRSQTISHLVLFGIATSGVVLPTLLEAADKDYELTVLSDCCADADEELQRVLMTRVFPRYARVTTGEVWDKKVSEGDY